MINQENYFVFHTISTAKKLMYKIKGVKYNYLCNMDVIVGFFNSIWNSTIKIHMRLWPILICLLVIQLRYFLSSHFFKLDRRESNRLNSPLLTDPWFPRSWEQTGCDMSFKVISVWIWSRLRRWLWNSYFFFLVLLDVEPSRNQMH